MALYKKINGALQRINNFEEELDAGIIVEMEHTTDPQEAEKVARDHLKEDPSYYTKLTEAGL